MRPQVVTQGEQIGDLRVTFSTGVDVVSPYTCSVLAEVETAWSSRHLRVQALASNTIAEALHPAVESIDRCCLAQNDKDVDYRLGGQAVDRRATDVMDSHNGVAEHP